MLLLLLNSAKSSDAAAVVTTQGGGFLPIYTFTKKQRGRIKRKDKEALIEEVKKLPPAELTKAAVKLISASMSESDTAILNYIEGIEGAGAELIEQARLRREQVAMELLLNEMEERASREMFINAILDAAILDSELEIQRLATLNAEYIATLRRDEELLVMLLAKGLI